MRAPIVFAAARARARRLQEHARQRLRRRRHRQRRLVGDRRRAGADRHARRQRQRRRDLPHRPTPSARSSRAAAQPSSSTVPRRRAERSPSPSTRSTASGNSLAFGQGSASLKSGATVTLTVTLGTGNVPSTDMAMCPTACPTLGATQCMGTQVQTCMMIDGCQTWGPAADCGSNMLCCSDGLRRRRRQQLLRLRHRLQRQHARLPADAAEVRLHRRHLRHRHAWAATPVDRRLRRLHGAARQLLPTSTSTPPASPAAPATPTCPFLTITAALTAANASTGANKVIHVAAGTYATGETFPLVVRSGISLAGAGATSDDHQGHRRVRPLRPRAAASTAPPTTSRSSPAIRPARRPSPNLTITNALTTPTRRLPRRLLRSGQRRQHPRARRRRRRCPRRRRC